jgi:biotin operon repressor
MPGRNELAVELGFNGKTVEAAIKLLEKEGLVVGQGAGRKRRIVSPETLASPKLRLAILDYEPKGETEARTIELQQLLGEVGHSVFLTEKSLLDLKMDVRRISQLVKNTQADAWVVCSASREVLEWFAQQEMPVLAHFGRRRELPIAAPA